MNRMKAKKGSGSHILDVCTNRNCRKQITVIIGLCISYGSCTEIIGTNKH